MKGLTKDGGQTGNRRKFLSGMPIHMHRSMYQIPKNIQSAVWKGTAIHKNIAGDNRRTVKQIYERSLVYQFTGTNENINWFLEK